MRAHSRGPLGSTECKMYSVGAEGAGGSAVWSRKIGVRGVSWTHLWQRTRNLAQPRARIRGRVLWRSSRVVAQGDHRLETQSLSRGL